MGGATGRVYSIHPEHFKVNRPQYTPELDYTDPAWALRAETSVMHMQARIRIAETCRNIVDAMPLGAGDVDTLPFPRLAALDKQFAQVLDSFPVLDVPALPGHASSPSRSQRRAALQHTVEILSVHARRAKLLRPLLRVRDLTGRFTGFRDQCLRSAETVLDLASTVLSDTISEASEKNGANGLKSQRSPYRSGLVINHVRRRAHYLYLYLVLLSFLPLLTPFAHPNRCPPSVLDTYRRHSITNKIKHSFSWRV